MALRGLKVLELSGLAPGPFCGMLLSDFGANVIRIDRSNDQNIAKLDRLSRGKRSISIDLKVPSGIDIFRRLSKSADVLIEPFRPGVMEKLGLGPTVLIHEDNKRLIYARLSGYGQNDSNSKLSLKAGHDINYLSISGVLSMLGRKNSKPHAPLNVIADFAGGGLLCAYAIMAALYNREQTGEGQILDLSLAEGSAYVSSWLYTSRDIPFVWFSEKQGENLLDGGAHFYDTYETKDGKYMAVGSLEKDFYSDLLIGLGLNPKDESNSQFNINEMTMKFEKIFLEKTQQEWIEIFDKLDACCTPVLNWTQAHEHEHNKKRKNFISSPTNNTHVPKPVPNFSLTPSHINLNLPYSGQHTVDILAEIGYSSTEIEQFLEQHVVHKTEKKLKAKL